MLKKTTKAALKIILFLVLVTGGCTGLLIYYTSPVLEKGENRTIVIREGMHLKEISGMIESEGLIKNSTVFILLAKIKGSSRRIKAGEYVLNPAMTPGRIMDIMTRGKVISHTVTIPEGFSIEQIADVLADSGIIEREKFLVYAMGQGVEHIYSVNGPGLEGYLYPDTYQFARGVSASAIIDTMINRFRDVTVQYEQKIAESGMTLHEVVTLASIVEKETGRASERPLIASVFLNRIKKRMRLESDPTVIYGIRDFSGNLKKRDLSTHTPYNTYVIRGLPPGPIANPGIDSIKAVLYPAKTNYLYFVSKNDGSHHFSSTLKEHNRAVYTYQKKRKG
ncbi:MAG: endolytic transglycosylase MltG [Deltaproteobacteria bacterium]|nr:endolytic transglycosylase MltG [Deltaproteobacteria bacterium]